MLRKWHKYRSINCVTTLCCTDTPLNSLLNVYGEEDNKMNLNSFNCFIIYNTLKYNNCRSPIPISLFQFSPPWSTSLVEGAEVCQIELASAF